MSNFNGFPVVSFTSSIVKIAGRKQYGYVDQKMPANVHLSQSVLIPRGGAAAGGEEIVGKISPCLDLMTVGQIAALTCVICIPVSIFICMVLMRNWDHDKEQNDEAGTISIAADTPATHTTKQGRWTAQGLSFTVKTLDATELWIRRITFPFRIFVYVHVFNAVMEMSHTMEELSGGIEHSIEGIRSGIKRHSKAMEEMNQNITTRLQGLIKAKGCERDVRNTTNGTIIKSRFFRRKHGNE